MEAQERKGTHRLVATRRQVSAQHTQTQQCGCECELIEEGAVGLSESPVEHCLPTTPVLNGVRAKPANLTML